MSTSALHHGPERFSSDTFDQQVWKAAKRTGLKARPDRGVESALPNARVRVVV